MSFIDEVSSARGTLHGMSGTWYYADCASHAYCGNCVAMRYNIYSECPVCGKLWGESTIPSVCPECGSFHKMCGAGDSAGVFIPDSSPYAQHEDVI